MFRIKPSNLRFDTEMTLNHLIEKFNAQKTQTDNAKSLNSRKSKCTRKLCRLYDFIYTVVDMRIGRLYEPKHEATSPQTELHRNLNSTELGLKVEIIFVKGSSKRCMLGGGVESRWIQSKPCRVRGSTALRPRSPY